MTTCRYRNLILFFQWLNSLSIVSLIIVHKESGATISFWSCAAGSYQLLLLRSYNSCQRNFSQSGLSLSATCWCWAESGAWWVLPMLWVRRPAHSAHCKQASKPQTQSIGASGGEWQWRRQSATNIHATLRASASCATLLNWRAPLTRSRDSENSNSNAT